MKTNLFFGLSALAAETRPDFLGKEDQSGLDTFQHLIEEDAINTKGRDLRHLMEATSQEPKGTSQAESSDTPDDIIADEALEIFSTYDPQLVPIIRRSQLSARAELQCITEDARAEFQRIMVDIPTGLWLAACTRDQQRLTDVLRNGRARDCPATLPEAVLLAKEVPMQTLHARTADTLIKLSQLLTKRWKALAARVGAEECERDLSNDEFMEAIMIMWDMVLFFQYTVPHLSDRMFSRLECMESELQRLVDVTIPLSLEILLRTGNCGEVAVGRFVRVFVVVTIFPEVTFC